MNWHLEGVLAQSVILLLLLTNSLVSANEKQLHVESFSNSECIICHEKTNPELVAGWRDSAHGNKKSMADCLSCHGNKHKGSTAVARRDTGCINCHGGEKAPEVHSYLTSKHGVIMRLERKQWDWSQPLKTANYRTPGCAYCHMHGGNHNVSMGVHARQTREITNAKETERVDDAMRAVCQDCHSPRYVTELFENGERMREIGRMKVREAQNILDEAKSQFTDKQLATAIKQFKNMRTVHLKNVYLGTGHQSPDYQWWHGHPALDSDLLHIKGEVSGLRRSHTNGFSD